MLHIGITASCASYIELVNDSDLSAEEKGNLRAASTVLKSRPMKMLQDFQKRKYGTATTVLGIHRKRTVLTSENFAIDLIQDEQHEDIAIVIEEDKSDDELNISLVEKGDVLVFKGTDDLPFELIVVNNNYNL